MVALGVRSIKRITRQAVARMIRDADGTIIGKNVRQSAIVDNTVFFDVLDWKGLLLQVTGAYIAYCAKDGLGREMFRGDQSDIEQFVTERDYARNDTIRRLFATLAGIGMRPLESPEIRSVPKKWMMKGRDSDGFWGIQRLGPV